MTDKRALEKAIDFIESLTRDPLLLTDDIEMTLDDVQAHARIELASIRKVLSEFPPQHVKAVKPLEWVETIEGAHRYAIAKTSIGVCHVFHMRISVKGALRDMYGWTWQRIDPGQKADSFEAAKAAAQADYGRRVLSCLSEN